MSIIDFFSRITEYFTDFFIFLKYGGIPNRYSKIDHNNDSIIDEHLFNNELGI